jgi:uncharacterized phiE125 gp8 family phage protein
VTTLPEAKTYLNLSTTQHDTELQLFIDRAEALVAERCGPLVATPKSGRYAAGSGGLALPVYPIRSLTSVTPVGGSALTISDLYVTDAGVVEWADGSPFGPGRYDVEWSAGHAADAGTVPADLKLGVLELIRHLWDTQRGASRTRTDAGTPGSAYIFPYRVEQALEPFTMDL